MCQLGLSQRVCVCVSEIEQNVSQLGLSLCVSEIEQNVCQPGLSHSVCVCEIEQNVCQLGLSHSVRDWTKRVPTRAVSQSVCVCACEIEQNTCQLGLSHTGDCPYLTGPQFPKAPSSVLPPHRRGKKAAVAPWSKNRCGATRRIFRTPQPSPKLPAWPFEVGWSKSTTWLTQG